MQSKKAELIKQKVESWLPGAGGWEKLRGAGQRV